MGVYQYSDEYQGRRGHQKAGCNTTVPTWRGFRPAVPAPMRRAECFAYNLGNRWLFRCQSGAEVVKKRRIKSLPAQNILELAFTRRRRLCESELEFSKWKLRIIRIEDDRKLVMSPDHCFLVGKGLHGTIALASSEATFILFSIFHGSSRVRKKGDF
jgi:hypothetical protein